jgi:hypothetical protein
LKIARFERPRAVSFVAGVLLFEAFLLAALGLLVVLVIDLPAWPPGSDAAPWLSASSGLAISLLVLLAAVGLFWMRPGAWLLAMTAQGLNLAHALVDYALGQPDYASMVLGIIVVLVLQQSEVRQAFRTRHA